MNEATLVNVLNALFPMLVIPLGISVGLWLVRTCMNLIREDPPTPPTHTIIARPIEEMPKQDTPVADVHYTINAKAPPEVKKDKDHCAYCGGKIHRDWYRCPNCGAPILS